VKVFEMELAAIQPSQLFISVEKLNQVEKNYAPLNPETLPPIPIKRLGDDIVFTDGHTRALVAHLYGFEKIRVFWDADELDWEAYEICVCWCKEARIRTIADLKGRIVSQEDYKVLWYQRCDQLHHDLAMRRGSVTGKEDNSDAVC
jgi:hypothetical protein